MRKLQKKVSSYQKSFLLCLLILLMMLQPGTAYGAARPEVDKETELVVEYRHNGAALPNAEFSIYRVGDISETARFTLSGSFRDYPVKVNELDSTGWGLAANTLAVYVKADQITAFDSKITDSQGHIDFGTLTTGLYLVIGRDVTIGQKIYRTAPFLVSLPGLGADDNWNYAVSASPKSSEESPVTPPPPPGGDSGGDKLKITVIKEWNDDGHRDLRPASIRVALLRDGSVYRTATLNASNYWRYTWSGLGDGYTWEAVEEDVPGDYTVTYTEEGTILTLTNSLLEEITDGDVPLGSVTLPDGPVPLAGLPQTGLLWWPVPLLSAAGMLLFGFGWKICFFKERKKDEE